MASSVVIAMGAPARSSIQEIGPGLPTFPSGTSTDIHERAHDDSKEF